MFHFLFAILGCRYHRLYGPWSTFYWPYSEVDAMDYSPWSTFFSHTWGSIPWTIVHVLLSVGRARQLIPWTIVHCPLSVGHTWSSIPWTIVHGPLSFGHTRGLIAWIIVHCPLSVGHTRRSIPWMFHFPLIILGGRYHGL